MAVVPALSAATQTASRAPEGRLKLTTSGALHQRGGVELSVRSQVSQ